MTRPIYNPFTEKDLQDLRLMADQIVTIINSHFEDDQTRLSYDFSFSNEILYYVHINLKFESRSYEYYPFFLHGIYYFAYINITKTNQFFRVSYNINSPSVTEVMLYSRFLQARHIDREITDKNQIKNFTISLMQNLAFETIEKQKGKYRIIDELGLDFARVSYGKDNYLVFEGTNYYERTILRYQQRKTRKLSADLFVSNIVTYLGLFIPAYEKYIPNKSTNTTDITT